MFNIHVDYPERGRGERGSSWKPRATARPEVRRACWTAERSCSSSTSCARCRSATTWSSTLRHSCAPRGPTRAGAPGLRQALGALGRRPARRPVPGPGGQGARLLDGRFSVSCDDVRGTPCPCCATACSATSPPPARASRRTTSSRRVIEATREPEYMDREPEHARTGTCRTELAETACAPERSARAARARVQRDSTARRTSASSVEFAEYREYTPGDPPPHRLGRLRAQRPLHGPPVPGGNQPAGLRLARHLREPGFRDEGHLEDRVRLLLAAGLLYVLVTRATRQASCSSTARLPGPLNPRPRSRACVPCSWLSRMSRRRAGRHRSRRA